MVCTLSSASAYLIMTNNLYQCVCCIFTGNVSLVPEGSLISALYQIM